MGGAEASEKNTQNEPIQIHLIRRGKRDTGLEPNAWSDVDGVIGETRRSGCVHIISAEEESSEVWFNWQTSPVVEWGAMDSRIP